MTFKIIQHCPAWIVQPELPSIVDEDIVNFLKNKEEEHSVLEDAKLNYISSKIWSSTLRSSLYIPTCTHPQVSLFFKFASKEVKQLVKECQATCRVIATFSLNTNLHIKQPIWIFYFHIYHLELSSSALWTCGGERWRPSFMNLWKKKQ